MMEPELEEMRQQVEHTKESLSEKLGAIEHNIVEAGEEAVETVQHAFDLEYQAEHHPWWTVGAAAALGFIAGRVILPSSYSSRSEDRHDRADSEPRRERREEKPSPVMEYLGSVFDQLGSVATTAATGVLGQVAHSLLQRKPSASESDPVA